MTALLLLQAERLRWRSPPRDNAMACTPAVPARNRDKPRKARLVARTEHGAERNFKPGWRRQPMTFERAIAEVERYLRGLGIPIFGEE